jgi:hypothetical protein
MLTWRPKAWELLFEDYCLETRFEALELKVGLGAGLGGAVDDGGKARSPARECCQACLYCRNPTRLGF